MGDTYASPSLVLTEWTWKNPFVPILVVTNLTIYWEPSLPLLPMCTFIYSPSHLTKSLNWTYIIVIIISELRKLTFSRCSFLVTEWQIWAFVLTLHHGFNIFWLFPSQTSLLRFHLQLCCIFFVAPIYLVIHLAYIFEYLLQARHGFRNWRQKVNKTKFLLLKCIDSGQSQATRQTR